MAFNKSHIVVLDAATMRGLCCALNLPIGGRNTRLAIPKKQHGASKTHTSLLSTKSSITAKDIAAAPHLKLIAITATGVNNINLEACKKHAVCVCNIRHYANRGLAEHTIGLIYALARGVVFHHNSSVAGQWKDGKVFSPDMERIYDIAGCQIGLIGSGASGRATAALAEKNGMCSVFLKKPTKATWIKVNAA